MAGILEHIQKETENSSCELIIVDMGSDDSTVATALSLLHQRKLNGCVIQNGKTCPSSALNAGLQRARGEYVTFLFARRVYSGILESFYTTACHTAADMVFGSLSADDARLAERQAISRVVKKKEGADYMIAALEGRLELDVAAVLLRRQFLMENQLWFQCDCRFGYGEEFLYKCLLRAKDVVQAPAIPVRMTELELRRAPAKPVGREVFQEIDAMVRVRDLLWCEHAQNSHLIDLMVCRRIPQAVMHCVDILIRNGFSPSAVKTELKKDSYQRLLKIGSCTGQELRRKIYRWNFPLHKYTLD